VIQKDLLEKKIFAVDIDGTITLNGMGTIHLEALSRLRSLKDDGHNVVLVTGRSSVEGYLLSIFGGLTHLSVGENGGCITFGDKIQHKLLGNKGECIHALATIQSKLDAEIKEKSVFPRMTEVVLERTFDIKQAQKIINEDTLSYFLNGAVIINSARGDMIDDEAMINALKSGKVFALGLDVYNGEPDIHPQYLKLDNVFILPHLGSATEKTRFAMADLAISNIEEYFKTGKCKNTVN